MQVKLSPLIVRIALWIVNTYIEFQINIFNNNKDITKCHSSLHANDDNDNAKAIAIPRGFSENNRAKNTVEGGEKAFAVSNKFCKSHSSSKPIFVSYLC